MTAASTGNGSVDVSVDVSVCLCLALSVSVSLTLSEIILTSFANYTSVRLIVLIRYGYVTYVTSVTEVMCTVYDIITYYHMLVIIYYVM